ncbi:probable protein S-acyltransferase 17 isoform X2 [Brassica napus]|uniref:probable protein S-acyltransferase 17 isoform X2 n=1 Tax=Brassica oleracea var. oleracea TaxID=109376 RepID=UPI0006A6C0C1|nr:PREDICTED: probable protein S-acyltransferase 17 isoform X2 [Brassica oleracea var. oleracea]XP_048625653.1 probable protein S-acyltransferase 17 isoform X2 [Brassica napus]
MEVQWVLVCHGMVTLTVVVSFLCGHSPVFKGTPIGWIHYFLTFGAWDYLLRFVEFVFGSKGTDAVLSVEGFCCDRPNPFLQIIYLLILGSTYFITVKSSFAYIPGYYIGEVHKYMSFGAVMIGVLLFLLTSFCDPGTVNAKNVSQYVSAYPYDDIIYSEKECPTCKIPKHFLLCLYGAVAIGFILAGRVKELRIVHILTTYYGIKNSFRSLAPRVLQWLVGTYNTQILLLVFFALISLLLAGFFGYHLNLCLTNTTTNEKFKWREYTSLQKKISEAKASAAALKAGMSNTELERPAMSKWRGLWRRSEAKAESIVAKRNMYDKGNFQNISEIVFPLSSRQGFQKPYHKSE